MCNIGRDVAVCFEIGQRISWGAEVQRRFRDTGVWKCGHPCHHTLSQSARTAELQTALPPSARQRRGCKNVPLWIMVWQHEYIIVASHCVVAKFRRGGQAQAFRRYSVRTSDTLPDVPVETLVFFSHFTDFFKNMSRYFGSYSRRHKVSSRTGSSSCLRGYPQSVRINVRIVPYSLTWTLPHILRF
jgi:hypothetical protein